MLMNPLNPKMGNDHDAADLQVETISWNFERINVSNGFRDVIWPMWAKLPNGHDLAHLQD